VGLHISVTFFVNRRFDAFLIFLSQVVRPGELKHKDHTE